MVTRVPDSTSAPALNSGSAVSVLIFLERLFVLVGFSLAFGSSELESVVGGDESVFSGGGVG